MKCEDFSHRRVEVPGNQLLRPSGGDFLTGKLPFTSADPNSRFFYPRLKGETEEDLKNKCIFPNYVAIYRPGVLMGPREESRFFESVAKVLLKPIATLAPTWITTPISTLAQAMVNAPFSLRSVIRDEARKPGSSIELDDLKAITVNNTIIFKLANEPVPSEAPTGGDVLK
ncbi:unnamed protein product [Echinostoma caproni]|uniref:NmrA domain-containing protein n=1 Tax=Echinostoma caproni TaxID=27848 RepID=A0A183BC58_9TREM|nr:unnamed protein product [Echinostoma caproni]